MTDIIIRKNSDGDICGFEMDGHAGFAEYGQDIVCAALSVLTINTINSIEAFAGDLIDVSSDEDKGIITCSFRNRTGNISDEATLLMKSYELGVNGIYEQYGKEFLNIKFEEV